MTRNNPVEPAFSRRGRFAGSIVAARGPARTLRLGSSRRSMWGLGIIPYGLSLTE